MLHSTALKELCNQKKYYLEKKLIRNGLRTAFHWTPWHCIYSILRNGCKNGQSKNGRLLHQGSYEVRCIVGSLKISLFLSSCLSIFFPPLSCVWVLVLNASRPPPPPVPSSSLLAPHLILILLISISSNFNLISFSSHLKASCDGRGRGQAS